ncbi:plasmid SOS inhibition protein A, partial [Hafnia alvei]
ERQGIYDDDLIEAVYAWSQRFSDMNSQKFLSGQPLWATLQAMRDELSVRNEPTQWMDWMLLNNKICQGVR